MTINDRFYKIDQSWVYEWIGTSNGYRRYRILIRRNAYDNQSFLRGFAFDRMSSSWQLLIDRPIVNAHCEAVNPRSDDTPDRNLFINDTREILMELVQIVND